MKHDAFCDLTLKRGPCDCGGVIRRSTTIVDQVGNGCAAALGKTAGALTGWGIFVWIFRHDIARAAAWVVAHVRIVP